MKYYNRRNYKDYRLDLSRAKEFGMPDSKDAFISSKEFARLYAKHLIEIAQRKNTEYSASGVLNTNDLIQMISWLFAKAWRRVNWEAINKLKGDERQKALWAYLKKTITYNLPHEIRYYKDGIRMTYWAYRKMRDNDYKDVFDAISSLIPQLDLEMAYADAVLANSDDNYNDWKTDIINEWFLEFLTQREALIVSLSLGIDMDKMKQREIADYLGKSYESVKKVFQRSMKKLKDEKAMLWLATRLDGMDMGDKTGANFLEFLK